MYVELGSGDKQIVYYNADKRHDVDMMLTRLVDAYKVMLAAGYTSIKNAERNCKMIFSSDRRINADLNVYISSRPCGIYVKKCAYQKQLAQTLYREIGLYIYETTTTDADLEIGIGGLYTDTQGFVLLKDALLELTAKV